ncbi:MAG: CmcI family methyltransferase [Lamprobacter sp.]|uniref:CmcI family methyltransferase n=1 Tax=Lamprobacter sp. TaxID=3100796 RepID=UPI002B25D913|nr:CmcI family methyltransferase [Lamprobacter sp.]MEA3643541.1 CmcI family methyltransferase [Lamprobacter sp.]
MRPHRRHPTGGGQWPAGGDPDAHAKPHANGSYCVVFDTLIEDMPADMFPDRPWGPGNNPKTAVHQYLKDHPEFEIDKQIDHKLLISVAPDGYLRRVG